MRSSMTLRSTARAQAIAKRFGVVLDQATLDKLSDEAIRQVFSWESKGSVQRLRAWARAAEQGKQWALGEQPEVSA